MRGVAGWANPVSPGKNVPLGGQNLLLSVPVRGKAPGINRVHGSAVDGGRADFAASFGHAGFFHDPEHAGIAFQCPGGDLGQSQIIEQMCHHG